MTDECIHGFPIELCDICAPRQREDAVKTPAPRRTRITSSLRSTPAAGRPAPKRSAAAVRAAEAEAAAPRVFSTLRAHHVTHIDNLPAIVESGAILASDQAVPSLDVTSTEGRAARAAAVAPDGSSVASHVPFSLSPDASRWNEMRTGAHDERWSDTARRARATEYVVLVVPVTAFGASVILADTDADAADARFAVGPDAATTLLRRTDLSDPDMLDVELLAGPTVPLTSVAVIGVANDRSRQDVRAILAERDGYAPRVAVFPPWFVPPMAD